MADASSPGKSPTRTIKILIADDEVILRDRLAAFLQSRGFDVRCARNGAEVHQVMENFRPDFAIYDLVLPDLNGMAFLQELKAADMLGENKIRVLVTSGHNSVSNIRECTRHGASDYLIKPVSNGDILQRIILHYQAKRDLPELSGAKRASVEDEGSHYYLHLTELILREGLKRAPVLETLHNLTGMLGVSLQAVRVSIVRCDFENRRGFVMASNDKKTINSLEINLAKYPEILYVLQHEKLLAVENLTNDPTMHFLSQKEKEIQFNSLIVCPLKIGNLCWGVLSVRLPSTRQSLHSFEVRYAQLVAHAAGLVIYRDPALSAPIKADSAA